MRKSLISFALVMFVSLSTVALNAASLAGVTLPDSAPGRRQANWCSTASACAPR